MKKNHNLVQKFRRFYFALPKEEQSALFDILSAIRGEDKGSFTLKTFTTARVRGALFGKSLPNFVHRALCFASLKKANAYDRRTWVGEPELIAEDLWGKADEHFKNHIRSAIRALREHGFKRSILDLMKFI